jgi:hypothetical protein
MFSFLVDVITCCQASYAEYDVPRSKQGVSAEPAAEAIRNEK